MRITHVCLNSIVTDGWNYQDNLLTKYHAKEGYDVSIITSRWIYNEQGKLEYTPDNCDYVNADNVRVVRLPMKGKENFRKKIKRFYNVYSTIKSTNPDILFIHSVNSIENVAIIKFLKENKNVIAYADNHADLTNSGTNWFSKNILHKIFWRSYAKKLIPYVKKFYGVLPVRVDFLTNIYGIPKEKCELLIMGADDDLVELANNNRDLNVIRNKFQIATNDFLIVTGGKIDPWKKETLALMDAVNDIGKNVKLIVFGSVDSSLKEEFTSRLSERVRYAGWVKAKESYNFFASADLVVFPGRHSVFWEQVVAQGIPMVCKDLPGTHHIDIGGNVIFAETHSAENLKNVLLKLTTDTVAYQNMKNSALSSKRNNFRYSVIADKSISAGQREI